MQGISKQKYTDTTIHHYGSAYNEHLAYNEYIFA